MIVAISGSDGYKEKDFSYIDKELNNIKSIPRAFDGDLYSRLGVSNSVIKYWEKIGYTPCYYYLFWLLQDNRWSMLFHQYIDICNIIVEKIYEENALLGEAVKEFVNSEQQGYEWFIDSNKNYVYFLSYSYNDDSGDNLMCTYDYSKVMNCMSEEIKKYDKDVKYKIVRFPVKYDEFGEFVGVDITDYQGKLAFLDMVFWKV